MQQQQLSKVALGPTYVRRYLSAKTKSNRTPKSYCPVCGSAWGQAFGLASICAIPVYAVLISSPRSALAQRMASSKAVFLSCGAAYAVALACALRAGLLSACVAAVRSCSPLPQVNSFANVLASDPGTTLAWLHLLVLDLYQARYVYLDGLQRGVLTVHSLVLCFMCGPLGLLSHVLTKAIAARVPRSRHLLKSA